MIHVGVLAWQFKNIFCALSFSIRRITKTTTFELNPICDHLEIKPFHIIKTSSAGVMCLQYIVLSSLDRVEEVITKHHASYILYNLHKTEQMKT